MERWQDDIFQAMLEARIEQVGYVPDAGHKAVIRACEADPGIEATVLTTEEEGIPLLVGAYLGGQRGVLLMQSSGVGNCINLLGLPQLMGVPLPMLVTMRGEWAEFNGWQVPMGQATRPVLEAMGVIVYRADRADEVGEIVQGAFEQAFNAECAVAVLLGQKLIGRKRW
ncbi:MAG: phosphonopyruvate decarboxylase [Geminicoccaceae bacterium]|nr:MAG: phosphonopyruvate decarboxylase [Geminicoccaceae bacterium]